MNERETREPKEYEMAHQHEEHGADATAPAYTAVIESLAVRQGALIGMVEKFMPAPVVELLRAKAIRERELLRESFERETRAVVAGKKAVQVLNPRFFELLKMDQQLLD